MKLKCRQEGRTKGGENRLSAQAKGQISYYLLLLQTRSPQKSSLQYTHACTRAHTHTTHTHTHHTTHYTQTHFSACFIHFYLYTPLQRSLVLCPLLPVCKMCQMVHFPSTPQPPLVLRLFLSKLGACFICFPGKLFFLRNTSHIHFQWVPLIWSSQYCSSRHLFPISYVWILFVHFVGHFLGNLGKGSPYHHLVWKYLYSTSLNSVLVHFTKTDF